ncbi:MAG: glycosyltransferase family 2 protein [Deltaproteobacteria bacterium]
MSGRAQLSVLIPAYNEEGTIRSVIERVRSVEVETEIIIVDDCSSDGTRDILRAMAAEDASLKVRFHERNQGKGAAIRSALAEATGEMVIVQDADMEYDPAEYPRLIQPILDDVADVVYGSRFLGGPHRVLFFWHEVANKFLTLVSNVLTNLNLTDMETGFKVFRMEAMRSMRLTTDRFGFEPEVTARVAQMRLRIYEMSIAYWGRDYEAGKKITWKDGVAALWYIFKFNVLDRMSYAAPIVDGETEPARSGNAGGEQSPEGG